MNERLLELVKKAGVSTTDHGRGPFIDDAVSLDDLEKFAELIVRECAKVANENVGAFTPGCGNSVLEHFGVKE